jgi:hypothetical protein
MSIEFSCPQCGKLLRVGDDAAGKQARCPSCNSVQPIPESPEMTKPFAAPARNAALGEPQVNPYQSPIDLPAAPVAPIPWGMKRPIQPTVIGVMEPLEGAWRICTENFAQLAMCLVAMIICFAINYAGQLLVQGLVMAVSAANPPLAIILVIVVASSVALLVFQAWIGVGQTLFFLKTARGEDVSLGVLFRGGPYLLATIVATLVVALALAAIALLCAIPAAGIYAATHEPAAGVISGVVLFLGAMLYFGLTYYQYYFLIPDQGLGGLEALRMSSEITKGNRLSLFGLYLIAMGVVFGSFLVFCFPVLFAVPFVMLVATIAYLKMAGQPTADERPSQSPAGSPFAPPPAELR